MQCLAKEDCAQTQQACNLTTNACDICKKNADCATGVCLDTGKCANAADVFYVDNRGMTTMQCKSGGNGLDGTSWASAFCDIKEALVMPRNFIVVRGSKLSYSSLNLTATNLPLKIQIIGPGKDAVPPAKIAEPDLAAVNIVANGANADVTLIGLDLNGAPLNSKPNGVQCSAQIGKASLVIKDSAIHDSAGIGVNANNGCRLEIDSSRVWGNGGGGLNLAMTTYAITNNFIIGNGSAFPGAAGVTFDNVSTGTFAFNTVVSNGPMKNLAGGISCGLAATKIIESSIIVDNTQSMQPAGSQFGGNCQFVNDVVGMDGVKSMGVSMLTAEFVNSTDSMKPFDFHLLQPSANNAACCVDKVGPGDGGVVTLPDHDVDGNHRPVNLLWDIGAHEVQ